MKRAPVIAALYVAAYLLLEWLCFARPALAPAITPWHPQAGLTLAFLVAVGAEWGVVTLIVSIFAQLYVRHSSASMAAIVAGAACMSLVSAALAIALRRVLPRASLDSTAGVATFAGLAATAALLTAAGYLGAFILMGDVPGSDALRGIARFGLGDLNGILMTTPLLLAGDPRAAFARAWRTRGIELFAQFASVLAILALIFALPDSEQLRFLYLLFVPVIWIALRWDWSGALPAVLIIQSALIFAAEADLHTPRFVDTQILMLTLTLTALLLGSVVAERRRSEQRLRERDAELSRAMRFAVAGELASATAHELNQPMTALVSYLNAAEILARAPGDDERLRATVRKAAAEALRASDVLHRLRNFYIGGRSRREPVKVSSLLATVSAAFADRLARAGIALEVMTDSPLPLIEADETQLHIVLHNLLANAIDAAHAGGGRRIVVRATGDAARVTISVEDSGAGIDAEIAGRIFEPFTTSKPDGMGLGLAISRTLVRAAGGELSVAPGTKLGGACLVISLPLKPPADTA